LPLFLYSVLLSTLKMKAATSSEKLVNIYQITERHISENSLYQDAKLIHITCKFVVLTTVDYLPYIKLPRLRSVQRAVLIVMDIKFGGIRKRAVVDYFDIFS
jgi:hypothetical protein